MTVRKTRGKVKKIIGERKTASGGIQLPAFGLAEEILGTVSSELGDFGELSRAVRSSELEARGAEIAIRSPELEVRSKNAELKSDGAELHLVTFNIDREEYGVEIGSVQEIIRVGQITPVPNAPKFIKGVINLRGKVIPVLNLRKRLNLPDSALTKNSRIMVVESGVKVLGMLVDSVSQVLRIPGASVDDPPSEVEQMKAYVRGIGKVDSRLIMIMDLNKALEKDAAAGEATARQPLPERTAR